MPRKTDPRRTKYVAAIRAMYGDAKTEFTRKELRAVSDANGWKWIPNWITHDQDRRLARGKFSITEGCAVLEPAASGDTAEFTVPAEPEQKVLDDVIDRLAADPMFAGSFNVT
jgi:hypothetical protein